MWCYFQILGRIKQFSHKEQKLTRPISGVEGTHNIGPVYSWPVGYYPLQWRRKKFKMVKIIWLKIMEWIVFSHFFKYSLWNILQILIFMCAPYINWSDDTAESDGILINFLWLKFHNRDENYSQYRREENWSVNHISIHGS